ncbi:MAG TPA: CheR family methyltransferase [Candidatus Limnocylindrales bacterium]
MTSEAPRHLVVVGSSAGGIEALSILVASLPKDLAAPVIVAQHLDPHRASHLTEILSARSTLPVITVEDRVELRDGTIHVVPSSGHVEIAQGQIRLVPAGDAGPVPSVDHILISASEAFGEGLIAVILTGMGSDGTFGARRVKAAGGTVIIQDPMTARFPSMPASLPPTSVDISAPIEAIGGVIADLLSETYVPGRAGDDRVLATFLATLRAESGIDFASYKRPTILRRLQRRMAAARTPLLRDYVRYLRDHPEEYNRLASSFLIKVTEFFRDPELFERLRDSIIPQLIENARRNGRELRIWSAGTATGEEAYSLALIVAEALGEELPAWTVRIFATDLDAEAVEFARRGVYPAAALADIPPALIDRHFHPRDGAFEVAKHIRALVVFGQHDLAMRAPFPRIDLVMCRNVLIYFTPELQKRALQLFAFSLRDGGWLVLGKAETTRPLPDYFAPEETRLKIYRRHGERLVVPPATYRHTPAVARVTPIGPRLVARGASFGPVVRGALPASTERAEVTLAALPIGIVVVAANYDILTINPAARDLLGIHSTAVGQDLVHLTDRLPSPDLRGIIDAAFAGRSESLTVEAPRGAGASEPVLLHVEAFPRAVDDGTAGDAAIVVVRDVTASGDARADVNRPGPIPFDPDSLGEQLAAYETANRRLLDDNRDLTAANLALKGSNEELLVANEEVQAATEEVETLNEELQSTNEELETLNEELQATVEELNTTNDDIHARTTELQAMTVGLEEQRRSAEMHRARLATLVETLSDAVLVVDGRGRAVIRNRAYAALFEESGIVPEDDEGNPLIPAGGLEERVSRGEEFVLQFRATDREGRRRWFEAYGRPMPKEMDLHDGGILVVHDTTDLSLRRLQEEFVAVVAHELRTPLTALRGYLQMLNREVAGDVDQRLAPRALEQAERLQRLVEELFDVTRADTGRLVVEPRPVRLDDILDQTVEIAQSLADGQRIEVERAAGDVLVNADPGRLQQVLLNVLTNAIVHASESPDILVRVRRVRKRAEIEIEDHGPGIAEADRAHLFSRFQQGQAARSRDSGLGLGLYVSRQIVLAHGGTIDVDSEPGEGTTFTIRLPLAGDGVAARQRAAASTGDAAGSNGDKAAPHGDGVASNGGRRASIPPPRRRPRA